jgi:lipid-A-disaccharide synthase
VVGILEVFKRYGTFRKIFSDVVAFLDREKPDAIVLVDYPGFNLRLAREAKARGIRVAYYISPQIWAWAPWRMRKIRAVVDLMLVLFPFEEKLYASAGVPVRYVGHPSLDRALAVPSREEWLASQLLDTACTYVALLPGSRSMEIARNFPVMIKAAARIHQQSPSTRFLIPCAEEHLRASIQRLLGENPLPDIFHIVDGQSMAVARASSLAMVASGTATLETALMETPMLVVYKVNPLTYLMARLLIRVDHLSLVNVLAGKDIVPEFLQHEARPESIAHEALVLLNDSSRVSQMKRDLQKVKSDLGSPGASTRAAEAIVRWLEKENNATVS